MYDVQYDGVSISQRRFRHFSTRKSGRDLDCFGPNRRRRTTIHVTESRSKSGEVDETSRQASHEHSALRESKYNRRARGDLRGLHKLSPLPGECGELRTNHGQVPQLFTERCVYAVATSSCSLNLLTRACAAVLMDLPI
ncbi:unnamed protein product [Scytosiphon promiscuus]